MGKVTIELTLPYQHNQQLEVQDVCDIHSWVLRLVGDAKTKSCNNENETYPYYLWGIEYSLPWKEILPYAFEIE